MNGKSFFGRHWAIVVLIIALAISFFCGLGFAQSEKKSEAETHVVEFEEVGRDGINILVYTPYTDRASLWAIAQHFKAREGNILMVSFFDKKIQGSTGDYRMSDHWWADYNYNKRTGNEELTFTGYGRDSWGKELPTKPVIVDRPDKEPKIEYRKPAMSMWTDVKLYYGPGTNKKYIGKIVCFKGDYVKVLYPTGSKEWKSRKAIIDLNGEWYIRKDDPALKAMKYLECPDSP